VREADTKVRERVKLLKVTHSNSAASSRTSAKQRRDWRLSSPTALVFIFVLIFMAFGSVRQALLVYSGIPLAVTGGIFALWMRVCRLASPLQSASSLERVAVLNGVVMISYFNQLREQGMMFAPL
jgi:cobalt-zinc-cadmium resistance protein CzcA